jgi:2,3-diketo-5-methylthio-1-phosphopentane phosphatase
MPTKILIAVDFDGTLSTRDSVQAMLEHFADPQWKKLEQDWLDSKISAAQCMQEQMRMVKADQTKLEHFFQGIELDSGFLAFYEYVKQFAEVIIVSDGLDIAIQRALQGAGLPEVKVFANRLHFLEDGIAISQPYKNPSCQNGNGVCKCAVVHGFEPGMVILIGDGRSDTCLAERADIVFAKARLAEHCQTHGIPFHAFGTFHDILAQVVSWFGEMKAS